MRDFLEWCLSNGIGGIVLLAGTGVAALLLVYAVAIVFFALVSKNFRRGFADGMKDQN